LVTILTINVIAQQQNSYSQKAGPGSISIGAFIGPSHLIEKAPDSLVSEIQDYLNKLRSGWHYGFQSEYFVNRYLGFGAVYSSFNTKQEVDSIAIKFFSQTYYINLSSRMNINTLSPMVYGRLPLAGNKLVIMGGVGPAWLFYRNIGTAVGDSATLKGSSPGLATSLRVSYDIIPNLSVGLQGSYIHAFLKEFTKDDGTTQEVITLEKAEYQNISRFDFSFGIFYTFRKK
jgi:hypothetical protein